MFRNGPVRKLTCLCQIRQDEAQMKRHPANNTWAIPVACGVKNHMKLLRDQHGFATKKRTKYLHEIFIQVLRFAEKITSKDLALASDRSHAC
mmetsp:Transcript_42009/g.46939  ORF Transcript_42009/g.46939 Transcript_42009/m.46939 type:complete len:92 (-) Transcript_42009:143-418(-)